MKVILTEKVKSLGGIGEIVNVSEGHGRNYLIPNKLAKLADESNKKQIADYNKMLAKKVAAEKSEAEAVAKKLNGLTINLIKKVGGTGRLFGTVTNSELSKELEAKDIHVERRLLVVETAIKSLGTFEVKAKLFTGVEATFNVKIEMSAEQAEEIKRKQAAVAAKAAKKGTEVEVEVEAETTEETTGETEA